MHIRVQQLGLEGHVLSLEQGFDLPSGDTVAPHVSFTSKAPWDAAPPPRPGQLLQVVPDLVVEVLSRSTKTRDRGEKKAIYEANGVTEYCLVDLERRVLAVFAFDSARAFHGDEHPRYLPPRVYGEGEQANTMLGPFAVAELLPSSLA